MQILHIMAMGEPQMTFGGIWAKMSISAHYTVRYKQSWKKKKKKSTPLYCLQHNIHETEQY